MENIELIDGILNDQKKFNRFIWFFSIILFAVLIAFGALLYHQKTTNANVSIDFTKTGAAVIISSNNKNPIAAQFLLPSSSRWTNTGINLNPNTKVNITASGRIHLASHKLIEAAEKDKIPVFGWCTPKGLPFKNQRQTDILRRSFLVEPRSNIGSIIGFLHKVGDPDPSLNNQRPNDLITIYEQTTIITPNYPVTLWLIINDVLLDPQRLEESKMAYIGPVEQLTSKEKQLKEKNWEYIVLNDYWDIWYDDNAGNYLVQLKVIGDH